MSGKLRAHIRSNIIGYVALFIALGGTTYAATGGNFILGNPNSASSTTSLSAPVAGKALQVTNTSTGAGATGLGLNVASGHPPFTVNSGTKVANLNADKLDGVDSTGFLPSGNVKSLRFIPGGCVNASDPGCTTTFSLGGLSLEASCFMTFGVDAHVKLRNTSPTSRVGIEYISGSSASQSFANAGQSLVDLSTAGLTPPIVRAQGSVLNLDTSKPETANIAIESFVVGTQASCGVWLVGAKPR
jgi:hypothetical protein